MVRVGASIGVVLIEPTSRVLAVDKLHDIADHEMYSIKERHDGGGVGVRRPGDLAPPVPAPTKAKHAEPTDLPEPSR